MPTVVNGHMEAAATKRKQFEYRPLRNEESDRSDNMDQLSPNKRQRQNSAEASVTLVTTTTTTANANANATAAAASSTAVVDRFNFYSWTPRAKYLIRKMRLLRFVDESTPINVVCALAKIADKLFIYAGYGKTGDGANLLRKMMTDDAAVDAVLASDFSDLSTATTTTGTTTGTSGSAGTADADAAVRKQKEIFWVFSSAFLICFFEVKAKKPFSIQYYHPPALGTQFLTLYPEFSDRGMQIDRLLTFHLCMQVAVSAFGKPIGNIVGNADKGCLVELVTRMTEGREVALLLNQTSAAAIETPLTTLLATANATATADLMVGQETDTDMAQGLGNIGSFALSYMPQGATFSAGGINNCRDIIYEKICVVKKSPDDLKKFIVGEEGEVAVAVSASMPLANKVVSKRDKAESAVKKVVSFGSSAFTATGAFFESGEAGGV
jgi:hypothetical protein